MGRGPDKKPRKLRESQSVLWRFMKHFHPSNSQDCWLWTGNIIGNGYGMIPLPKRHKSKESGVYAHRYSWQLHNSPIKEGMTVDHLCHQKSCLNPSHMEIVSLAENGRRGAIYRWEKEG
jgi:hypothetical protein